MIIGPLLSASTIFPDTVTKGRRRISKFSTATCGSPCFAIGRKTCVEVYLECVTENYSRAYDGNSRKEKRPSAPVTTSRNRKADVPETEIFAPSTGLRVMGFNARPVIEIVGCRTATGFVTAPRSFSSRCVKTTSPDSLRSVPAVNTASETCKLAARLMPSYSIPRSLKRPSFPLIAPSSGHTSAFTSRNHNGR